MLVDSRSSLCLCSSACSPLIGYVTRLGQQDRFSASVDEPDDEDEDGSNDIDTEHVDSDKTEGDELKQ
jgi:hypothetical protein